MQLLTAASRHVTLGDRHRRFSHITRRLVKGLTVSLPVIAGISAAPGSAGANENAIVIIPSLSDQAAPMIHSDAPLILADPTNIQTVDPNPFTRFHGKAYRQLGAEPVPIPDPSASPISGRPGRGGLGVLALPNLRRLW